MRKKKEEEGVDLFMPMYSIYLHYLTLLNCVEVAAGQTLWHTA